MPIYDYSCTSCGHLTEVIHGMSEPGPRFCPSCGAEGTMRKGFATPAVLFKGSGWARKERSSGSRSRSGGESVSTDGAPAEKPASGDGSGSATTTTKSDATKSAPSSSGD